MKISTITLAIALTYSNAALASEDQQQSAETIIVTAPRLTAETIETQAEDSTSTNPDGAAFIARQPGAALVDNGALSGQVQMRGLFGERILLRINGQNFAKGGPNAMDPAMHYAPMALIGRVEIARGISPVRDGPGLGGGVNTILKQVKFGNSGSWSPQIDLSAQYRSVDDGVALGGMAGLANEQFRIGVIGSYEQGDDTRFPGGRIGGTSYERAVFGAHAGFNAGPGEISLEYRRQETDASGTPTFAMDIVYFNTDFVRIGFEGDITDQLQLEAHANYTGVEHRMNNFSLRPDPAIPATRQTNTYANTMSSDISLRFGSVSRHLLIGADFALVDNGYVIYNPFNSNFFLNALDHGKTDRFAAYAEWRTGFGPIEAELGARIDRHSASTGAPRLGSAVPMGPVLLANNFTLADRDWSATSVDAAVRLWADAGAFTPRLTLAHKTRAPSLIERFAWLPTEASGGLADGNIYVGSPDLKIEKAWIAEIGLDWASNSAYVRPAVYYRRIDDYIQGVPFDSTPGVINSPVEMVAAMNGDPTPLRFANTDAEIYGADIAFGTSIAGPLRIDGVASYVRGKRRDIDDNLYRIAPANGRLALGWEADQWSVTLEGVALARQNKVSASNSEQTSKGYIVASVYGNWLIRDGLRVDLGIENLFDKQYTPHLAGYNRNAGSDVPLGTRIPGSGRSGFIRLRWGV